MGCQNKPKEVGHDIGRENQTLTGPTGKEERVHDVRALGRHGSDDGAAVRAFMDASDGMAAAGRVGRRGGPEGGRD